MSADEGSPTEGLTEEQRRLRDIEDQVIQQERMEDAIESADPGGAESAGSSVSSRRSAGSERQAAASMQDSAPGDWEEAFAESPSSLDRSQGIGPTDIETTDLPSPAGYSSSAHSAEGDADLTDAPWRHSTGIEVHQERQTHLTYAPGGSEGAGGGGGPSPDRSRPERSAITLREDEDRIEQAPQSTPRPGSEDRSPNRSRKRPREGSSADMPSAKSAKCVVRRLGALIPTSQPRPILMSTPKHEDPLEAAAQALRQLLHAWKRLLGLTPCSRLPDVPERMSVKPSVAQRFCPALWMLVFLLIALGGVGLQWARCQRAYLARLTPEHAKPDNATMQEYVCQHSFVWTYLLPRLIFLMGYISVFVCWFCLKHPDFITVIADTYDTVTDQHEYPGVSERYVMYCRFDRRVLTFLFVFVAVLSAVGTLVGDGVIAGTAAGTAAAAARDTKHAGIVLASDVFNFVIKLVHDNVMFLVLASHTLSLKYFDLMLQKTQLHFGNIVNQAHISSDAFVRKQYMRGYRLMAQSQAAVSAVMLMVLLRVCQAIVLIILDQTQKVPRTESLGLLPLVVTYTVMVFVNIYRCCGLTKDGRLHHARHLSTGPDFAKGGAQDPEEGGDEGGDNAARLEPRAGAAGGGGTPNEWSPALDPCPAITGRVFGVDAGPWLFVVVILVMAGYCGGYYAVERYWPLF